MTTAVEEFLRWLSRNEFDARIEDRASAEEYGQWALASWDDAWSAFIGEAVVSECDA